MALNASKCDRVMTLGFKGLMIRQTTTGDYTAQEAAGISSYLHQ